MEKITAYYTFLEDYIKKLKEHSEANGEIMFNYEFHNLRIIVDKIFSLLFKFNFLEKIILNFLFPITNQELHNMESCPICMECNTVEESKKLKCGHIYHKNCIIKCFKTPIILLRKMNLNYVVLTVDNLYSNLKKKQLVINKK